MNLSKHKVQEIRRVANQVGESELIRDIFMGYISPHTFNKMFTKMQDNGMEFTWSEDKELCLRDKE